MATPPGWLNASGPRTCSAVVDAARLVANCSVSVVLTSVMMPRPSWASRPSSWRSESTLTWVSSAERASRRAVMWASASPWFPSPLAFTMMRCRSRSCSNVAVPVNRAASTPRRTLTTPWCSSPTTSVRWAPGTQRATRAGSQSSAQASSIGRAIVNESLSSTGGDPRGCRCRADHRRPARDARGRGAAA